MRSFGLALIFGLWSCGPEPRTGEAFSAPESRDTPSRKPTVEGTVSLKGEAGGRYRILVERLGPEYERMYPKGLFYEPVLVDDKKRIQYAVVYVKKGLEGRSFEAPKQIRSIDYENCQLKPRVLGIFAGQEVVFRNRDNDTHIAHVSTFEEKETHRILAKGESFTHAFANGNHRLTESVPSARGARSGPVRPSLPAAPPAR